MMTNRFLRSLTLVVMLLGVFVTLHRTASLQPPADAVCPALVQDALRELETNCGGLGRNVACYGYNRIGATFSQEVETGFFSRPADRADLVTLQSISTAPMDIVNNEWGVALLNTQANLPGTLPGQSVTFILLGDATVVNAVPADAAALPVDPVVVTAAVETPLRSFATSTSNTLAVVPAGAELAADALSQDGSWARVVYDQSGGWVRRDALASADLSRLPVVTDETYTPMQAFVFRTGIQQPACSEAPNSVVIQGPTNTQVNLNVNGADIVVGSTVTMSSVQGAPSEIVENLDLPGDVEDRLGDTPGSGLPDEQECALMQLSVVSGEALLNDGQFVLPEGNAAWSVFCGAPGETLPNDLDLDATEEPGSEQPPETVTFASDWGAFRTLDEEELQALQVLEELPPAVLNYAIDVPEEDEITPAYQNTPTATATLPPLGLAATSTPTLTPTPAPSLTPTNPPPPPPTARPGEGTPHTVVPSPASDNQTAVVGQPFPEPFRVSVVDPYNNPLSGVAVTFSAPASGASGTFAASAANVETVVTDSAGAAVASAFTGNTVAGSYSVVASVETATALKDTVFARRQTQVVSTTNALISGAFSVTNAPAAPAAIAATAGTPQSATVGTPFTVGLQARITDAYGNGVPGVSVTFTAPTSGASGSFDGDTTVSTNALGYANAPAFSANAAAGSYAVTASAGTLTANFDLTNAAGRPASITATAGTPQSATVTTPFSTPLQAHVTDSYGNGVPGVSVTFTAPASGGSGAFDGDTTVSTNALGYANAPAFSANTVAGSYVVTASAGTLTVNFDLTNTPGDPASITATAGTPQSAQVNTAFATGLQVQVLDTYSNPVSGAGVTFTAPASGASGTFGGSPTVTTDASGFATAPTFTANSQAGSYMVTASAGALTVNFDLTNTPGDPASITATAGTPQSATIGTPFTVGLQARITDTYGNGVPNVSVTFMAPASGASGTFASTSSPAETVTTDASGTASASDFTANATIGSYVVTASAGALTANFDLTNTNPVPVISGLSQSSATTCTGFNLTIDGSNFVNGAVVTWQGQADLPPTTLTSTAITVDVPAAYLASVGIFSVGVTNPTPGGGPSNAQTFTVNPGTVVTSLNDSGPCSLRDVIAGAPPGSTITFAVTGAIPLTSVITINKSLTIQGPGAESLTVSGNGSTRIFTLSGGGGISITLAGLHLDQGGGGGGGGTIGSEVTLTLNNVWISGSTGSGIYTIEGGGSVFIANSTFSGNTATADVGGAFHANVNFTVVNSTFQGNGGSWGAFSARMGHVSVYNSTFADNSGIENQGLFGSTVTLYNVILYNTPCGGTFSDGGGNLINTGSCDGLTPAVTGDPLLQPLGFNGGGTRTMGLGAGSPALNAAVGSVCTSAPVNGIDQRGVGRGDPCDIGAYEG